MTSDQTLREYFSNLKKTEKNPKKITYFSSELGVDTNPLPEEVMK